MSYLICSYFSFYCGALSNQLACLFVFYSFCYFTSYDKKKPESKYKNTKAVTQKPQHTSASFHFYITVIWQICLSFQRYEFTVRLNMEMNCFNLCKLVFAKKKTTQISRCYPSNPRSKIIIQGQSKRFRFVSLWHALSVIRKNILRDFYFTRLYLHRINLSKDILKTGLNLTCLCNSLCALA